MIANAISMTPRGLVLTSNGVFCLLFISYLSTPSLCSLIVLVVVVVVVVLSSYPL